MTLDANIFAVVRSHHTAPIKSKRCRKVAFFLCEGGLRVFSGSVNQDIRSVISEVAESWRGKPVYVGCSGNFTIERILWENGVREIHSNDVSLYSCLLGNHLAGKKLPVKIIAPEYTWLYEYMQGGESSIATLLLLIKMSEVIGKKGRFYERKLGAYLREFPSLHEKTVEKVKRALGDMKIESFYDGDVMEFAACVPEGAAVISFPPKKKGGYEKQYKVIESIFDWDRPSYEIFEKGAAPTLESIMKSKEHWLFSTEDEYKNMADRLRAVIQTSMRAAPIYIYSSEGPKKLSMPKVKSENVFIPRLVDGITGNIKIVDLTQGQLDAIRAQYLGKNIVPGAASYRFGLVDDGRLFGVVAFNRPSFDIMPNMLYMMTGLGVSSSIYRRLSKLTLAVVVSKEMQTILEQRTGRKFDNIFTTAFTEKSVSMKYRGIFDVYNKTDGKVNYHAKAGIWTMKEGFEWWMTKHGAVLTD